MTLGFIARYLNFLITLKVQDIQQRAAMSGRYRSVGVITCFSSDIANTRYGIAVMLEKVLRFSDSIVDFQRSFKCSA